MPFVTAVCNFESTRNLQFIFVCILFLFLFSRQSETKRPKEHKMVFNIALNENSQNGLHFHVLCNLCALLGTIESGEVLGSQSTRCFPKKSRLAKRKKNASYKYGNVNHNISILKNEVFQLPFIFMISTKPCLDVN